MAPRLVYVSPSGALGGAELVLLDLLVTVPRTWHDVEQHLVLLAEGPLATRARALGAIVHERPMPQALAGLGDSAFRAKNRARAAFALAGRALPAAGAALGYVRRLRGLIDGLRPLLIHSNGIKSHLLIDLARVRSAPVSWHVHDFWGSRPLIRPALRLASQRAVAAIAISKSVAADARRVLARTPIEVVYNGVDLDFYAPGAGDGTQLDKLAGLPPAATRTLRVGLVATYARWKGHDVFIEAAARVRAAHPDLPIRFFIAGGPIYATKGSQFSRDELQGLAEARGLSDHFGLIAFQENTAAIYRGLDIVVHASTQPEPFGRTIAEAMACARPVIVSAAGGAAELFEPNGDGVGFVPGDPLALAEAIRGLATDPALRQRLASAARQTAVERFSRERFGREAATIFQRLAR